MAGPCHVTQLPRPVLQIVLPALRSLLRPHPQEAPVRTTTALADAQRRLQLVLRSQHGPRATQVWASACARAGVVCTGELSLDELDRVTAVLAERGGADAVAARSCRVKLVFLRRTVSDPLLEELREPDALDEASWRRRLAELEAGLGAA